MDNNARKFSIILPVHDEAEALEQNLPLFLNADAEVIVVDNASGDETPDVLKRLRKEHANLYTTFLPKSTVPNPSRLRLAMTLGKKAAHGEWLIFADIHRPPQSDDWQQFLDDGQEAEVVLFYAQRANGSPVICHPFPLLEEAVPFILKAERRSGHGHQGRLFLKMRGHYSVAAVRRHRAFDTIHYFDQSVSGMRLMRLRLSVLWTNLFS